MHQAHRIAPAPQPVPAPAAALVRLAAISGIAFVLLALVVAGGPLSIDLSAADALRPFASGVTGAAVKVVNLAGQAFVWDPLLVVIAAVLWTRGHRVEAVVLLAGALAAEGGASVAKLLVNRERPPGIAVQDLVTQASFPSGHMTRAVVGSGLLAWVASRRAGWRLSAAILAIAFSAAMGVARVAVGEHWLTDVIGAALYGLFALAVIWLVVDRLRLQLSRRLGERPAR